jgi:putative transposase
VPRRLRIHLPGGFYHVTLRGNHQRAIFFTDSDPLLLNDIVARALLRHEVRLHAYCWMTNHIHLFLQVNQSPLGSFMRQVALEFARRMQWHLPTSGHFFERRYHATLVDTDEYLKAVVRYVHLNPVEAGLCANPSEYPWSSHHEYLGEREGSWITTDFVLREFGSTRECAVAAYRAFLADRASPEWTAKLEIGPDAADALGDEHFISRSLAPVAQTTRQTLEELICEGCGRFMVTEGLLVSPVRDPVLSQARCWIALEARKRGIATLSAVARRLNRDESTLRQAMREAVGESKAG